MSAGHPYPMQNTQLPGQFFPMSMVGPPPRAYGMPGGAAPPAPEAADPLLEPDDDERSRPPDDAATGLLS